ncbi:MAG: polyamine aminopropyltransferase [Alphaproteobacteria bacterium]|nr:polyamine aminopropyltransferase [Alphaproteobacteria bacterium]
MFAEEETVTGVMQRLKVGRVLHHERTEVQNLVVFEHGFLGRVMTLDGAVQTTEFDEFIYHEMLAHTSILAHGAAKKVLIIGGGDGGMAEEALKHPIERLLQVDIDRSVCDIAQVHLSSICKGAFEDPRMELMIADGVDYVSKAPEQFDVIIVDSTDPIGPGEVLFTESFYRDCKKCLTPGGIIVTQNGIPMLEVHSQQRSYIRLGKSFADVTFFLAPVPTYYGGHMAFGFASDDPAKKDVPLEILEERFEKSGIDTQYYNPEIHRGAFAHPQFFKKALKEALGG